MNEIPINFILPFILAIYFPFISKAKFVLYE
jgi:hypothetical protein